MAETAEPQESTQERERRRREAADQKRRYREAKRQEAAKPKPEQPAAEAKPAAPAPDARSDQDRARDAAVFIQGAWMFARFAAFVVGFELEALTDTEALEDGKSWVPIARRYRFFDVLITWIAAPVNLLRRVAGKLRRKRKDEPKKEGAK